MHGSLIRGCVLIALCGQCSALWPFTSSNSPTPATKTVEQEQQQHQQPLYDPSIKRVAIIGGGAAGASSAYHLQKYAALSDFPINITVFERSSYVGGRSTTVNAYDDPRERVELGASIFVEVNTILKNASEAFGLVRKVSDTEDAEVLGIWNGESFVFTQKDSGWKYWDIAKLLWKYGYAPIRTQNLMKSVVSNFGKLYEEPFFPFRDLTQRVVDLGLSAVTSMTGEQYLAANNIGAPFSTDIIQASTRVNYGQNLNLIHGLETMVCMAIEGAMQIEGGNWQIFDEMIKSSNATLLLNSSVTAITKNKSQYNVKIQSQGSENVPYTTEEPYDSVIIAAPLQYANISIEDELFKHLPDEIPYVTLHVTLFTSAQKLNPIFFNLAPDAEVPTTILTTLPPGSSTPSREDGAGLAGFWSISTLRTVINPATLEKENLYKIFSPSKLSSDFLYKILAPDPSSTNSSADPITWIYPHVWNSYPYEYPRVTFEEIELARNVYYTSGIESFISTMETSALMGKNVARLVMDDYLSVLEEQMSVQEGKSQIVFGAEAQNVLGEQMHVEEL